MDVSICKGVLPSENVRKISMFKSFPRQYSGVLKLLGSGARLPNLTRKPPTLLKSEMPRDTLFMFTFMGLPLYIFFLLLFGLKIKLSLVSFAVSRRTHYGFEGFKLFF